MLSNYNIVNQDIRGMLYIQGDDTVYDVTRYELTQSLHNAYMIPRTSKLYLTINYDHNIFKQQSIKSDMYISCINFDLRGCIITELSSVHNSSHSVSIEMVVEIDSYSLLEEQILPNWAKYENRNKIINDLLDD